MLTIMGPMGIEDCLEQFGYEMYAIVVFKQEFLLCPIFVTDHYHGANGYRRLFGAISL